MRKHTHNILKILKHLLVGVSFVLGFLLLNWVLTVVLMLFTPTFTDQEYEVKDISGEEVIASLQEMVSADSTIICKVEQYDSIITELDEYYIVWLFDRKLNFDLSFDVMKRKPAQIYLRGGYDRESGLNQFDMYIDITKEERERVLEEFEIQILDRLGQYKRRGYWKEPMVRMFKFVDNYTLGLFS